MREDIIKLFKDGVIVACQAEEHEPLHGAQFMAGMAKSAQIGGALGIRANGLLDIAAIRLSVNLPIIGSHRVDTPGYIVRITPTIEIARQVAAAGADIIAVDATNRPHPDGLSIQERIKAIHRDTGRCVMADIASFEEGLAAEEAGAELVATTLSGYVHTAQLSLDPDFKLIAQLANRLKIPVIAEGRFTTPDQAAHALDLGAYAVVVGSPITRPQWITAQFVNRLKNN